MRPLSKSKLIAYRQCPKRLWLEIHKPGLRTDSAQAIAQFDQGHQVGTLARFLYDPDEIGLDLEPRISGKSDIFSQTQSLLAFAVPLFEAGFKTSGALALADVLLPVKTGRRTTWRMIEVKSSTSAKDYQRDDLAIQAYVAKAAGLPLHSVAIAHINADWVYQRDGDYSGIFTEVDCTEEVLAREQEVTQWIADAQSVARKRMAPTTATGTHCTKPFECGFIAHCRSQEAQPIYPVQWLPRVQTNALKTHLDNLESQELQDVPDHLLNPVQLRVKQHTLSGKSYFDSEGAFRLLKQYKAHKPPLYFLDFETVQMAIPRWLGQQPYQQVAFQFSCHFLSKSGKLHHREFLDLSGENPSKALAKALIDACGSQGAIIAYSADFEKSRIRQLAQRFPRLKTALLAILERMVDLLPVANQHYYHPDMQGSWSIKKVLPSLVPALSYGVLEGVQHGGDAMAAYLAAIDEFSTAQEQAELEAQLRNYCALDTYAMVRMWQIFAGRSDLKL